MSDEPAPWTPAQLIILRKLQQDCRTDNLGADPAATMKAMDARYSFSSTRMALSALKKAYPGVKEFAVEAKKRRLQYKKLDESQEPTDKQRDKYVKWEDVQTFREEYREEMTPTEYFVLSLYTMWPPARADYTPMKVVNRKPRDLEDGINYLILRPKTVDVLFHAYKTHAQYGDITRRMPKRLADLTRAYVEEHPGTYLFQSKDGTPWMPQRLGTTLRRIFQRFHDMDTGISTLRHSYATHIYKGMPGLKELERKSRPLMHSILTSQAYRHLDLED